MIYTHPDPVAPVLHDDPIVSAVCAKMKQRSQVGQAEYGCGLNRTDLSRLDWLQHAQEEAMDLANYLEVLIQREIGG